MQDFAQANRKLADDAFASIQEELRNRFAIDHSMNNLRKREIRSAVYLYRATSMELGMQSAIAAAIMQTLQHKILIWSHYATLPKSAELCLQCYGSLNNNARHD